eukprot:GHVT01067940.1.p3 GENE.GHVT01067940.1~~GHVT01067940.1.p3  ORF type:complete len:131 (-),score=12.38 GHVT01067940.1:2193-2585(-)
MQELCSERFSLPINWLDKFISRSHRSIQGATIHWNHCRIQRQQLRAASLTSLANDDRQDSYYDDHCPASCERPVRRLQDEPIYSPGQHTLATGMPVVIENKREETARKGGEHQEQRRRGAADLRRGHSRR